MKSKKIAMGAGALLLAIAGVFVGRASTKFSTAAAIFYTTGGVCTQLAISSANIPANFTTTTVSGTHQATFQTAANGLTAKLYYTSHCGATKAIYFQP